VIKLNYHRRHLYSSAAYASIPPDEKQKTRVLRKSRSIESYLLAYARKDGNMKQKCPL